MLRQLGLRLVQLLAGLLLYGISMALMIRSQLGNMPWDVLHQGLARHLGHSIGTVTIGVGVTVLLAWIPLREKPGIGTVCNVVVIGFSVDAALRLLPSVDSLPLRALLAGAGVLLNAVATAAYIGVRLGPGPRDGLMTGLVRRTGGSLRLVRTAIEVTVVATGWALGGTLGITTLVYALAIGPLVQLFLPRVLFKDHQPALTPEGGHSSA
ncbi:MAG: YczE/YyaS/YitT family protein [Pseudonocardiaceae bacterium]